LKHILEENELEEESSMKDDESEEDIEVVR
jgi:hypothetical protein